MRSISRTLVAGVAVAATLGLAAPAQAEITSVFGGQVPCTVGAGGVRECSGITTSFDGAPIDVNAYFPSGSDEPFPLVGQFHGWGGSKLGRSVANHWLDQGYAFFSISDRGWGNSCGAFDPKRLNPLSGCANGYNHLMDTRFEVRDAQDLMGLLVDDGVVDPDAIGATGGSYGGGMSMSLAALNDRQMLPDGSLIPWESAGGVPMHLAAAAPDIPWTDLAYSLQPNGRTLDYVAEAPYLGPAGDKPIGILKQSFVSGLYGIGLATSNYAPPGSDPDADLNAWYALISAGEPYDDNPLSADIVDELTSHHSSYYIDDSREPAPLHISNGTTDDLFPPDEAVRFYNKTLSKFPGANLQLYFLDEGHQRGQNKGDDTAKRIASQDAWFAHFLKGEGAEPANQVTMITHECPKAAPSQGPYSAPDWRQIAPGEVRFQGGSEVTLIAPEAGDPSRGQAYDPIAGRGACATTADADAPGTANYALDPAPAGGYTLLGSPTVVANIFSPGPHSQIAARLLDVDPGTGDATLVSRGLYRPDQNTDSAGTRQVFQLHPASYLFEEGHLAKLELLPNDSPYGRPTNGQAPITISKVDLRLPVRETPGGPVTAPAAKVVPPGYELAPDFASEPIDSDGDGIADDDDACPYQPGPANDADPTKNGCPPDDPPDSDGDGVPDDNDACPTVPGPPENGGCPVDQDRDGDGILNEDDDCPDDPGPASSEPGKNGCPAPDPPDRDHDGIPDSEDVCPDDAGPAETFGCPDRDSDGTPDLSDQCPDDPGPASNSGCPEANPPDPPDPPGPASCLDNRIDGDDANNRIDGTDGPDRIKGRRGNDRISAFGGDDCVFGQAGSDRLLGGSGDDELRGGSGGDRLLGGSGDDLLKAGKGKDRLRAGPGDDEIKVRDGKRDLVRCGAGTDTVTADRKDRLRGCEQVKRSGKRKRR